VRGLLVVNPRATTTSSRVVDVIVHAFSADIDLDVTVTTHRGHGRTLGERARAEGMDVVVTLGGDGVINEVVNGMLHDGPGPDVPMLAPVPGGSANVVARALGIPNDAVEATGLLLEQLRDGVCRTIGLGHARWQADGRTEAGSQWFLANSGLGLDAEIIDAMERHRARGRAATPLRYLSTTLNAFFRSTDRKDPALTIRDESALGAPTSWPSDETTGRMVEDGFFAFVQNTSPWTFLGTRPINPCPQASFDTGLDMFALRRMHVPTALVAATRMVRNRGTRDARGGLVTWHDRDAFHVSASRPVSFQIDGESIGPIREVSFSAQPHALRVVS
jgi:diacylglycerol kinase family enzyme